MSVEDEIRYGRTCSLVLNKSVAVLRRVVKHSYTTQGAPSFEVFLNNNKHTLFHLLFKQCCCGNKSTVTPLSKYQWKLLYVQTSTRNPHGQRGECPCQYTAISGVTPDVMDISLCCLVLSNICPGVSMPDIDTIRDVRNKLIHASNASLDAMLYLATWNKVEAAMLNLAQGVSSTFRSDTINAVEDLKNRLMDSSELSELKALVMDEKRISEGERRISEIEKKQDITQDELVQHKIQTHDRICHVESEIETLREDQTALMSGILQQKDFPEEKISELKQALLESYTRATEKIQVSPLQKRAKKVPLDMIFAPVVIRQDLEDKTTESNQDHSTPYMETQQVRNPKDMFYKNDKSVRHIFMQGEAAHGKTVYSKRLLQYWCASKQVGAQEGVFSEWEKCLDEFDFVFFVMFRLVNKTTTSIVDMILDEVSQHSPECVDAIRHVLSNKKYRCLIIMDGLDEWRTSKKQRRNLRHKRFPNFGDLSKSCSLFITFRPWVYDVIADMVESCDRVVGICGLDAGGIDLVIENMLVNFYNMDTTSEKYKETKRKMFEKSQDEHLKSIMEVPLLVTASVMLWFDKEHVEGGLTSFYISLVQLLIKRALDTDAVDEDLIGRLERKSAGIHVPNILQTARNKTVRKFIGVLNNLGKIAYDDLLSDETNLVFGKEELEDNIDEDDMAFALRVGLLSQCEAPGCFDEENVSVNFFHKTVQEFLCAIHVVCNKSRILNELCSHLQSIDVLYDLSNVVMFLSGLSPAVGDKLSQHVANLSKIDTDICKYRDEFHYDLKSVKVTQLYQFQILCYKEMKSEGSLPPDDHKFIKFHGKDIFFTYLFADSNIWLYTFEILGHLPCILTLNLNMTFLKDPIEENRINIALSDLLANSETLHSIRLVDFRNTLPNFGRHLLLKHLCLSRVTLSEDAFCGILESVKSCLQLERLELIEVTRRIETDSASGMSQDAWLQNLLHVLPDCLNLTTLHIDHKTIQNKENAVVLMTVLPKLKNLHEFDYTGTCSIGNAARLGLLDCNLIVANSLKNSYQLRKLQVRNVNLRDYPPQPEEIYKLRRKKSLGKDVKTRYDQDDVRQIPFLDDRIMIDPRLSNGISIELTSAWTNLQKLEFFCLYMSPLGWYKFLISLLEIRHSFDVEILITDIDEKSVSMTRSCPFFSIKRHEASPPLTSRLEFTKVEKTDKPM